MLVWCGSGGTKIGKRMGYGGLFVWVLVAVDGVLILESEPLEEFEMRGKRGEEQAEKRAGGGFTRRQG